MPDYPQTNEHKIISTNLLSPRPGWNRRWCYHRQVPKPLCKSHRNLGTSPHSAIWHKPTSYGRIHKSAFSGRKSLNLTSFCPLSRSISRHFALLEAVFQLYTGQFTNFLTPRHRKRCIYAWLHSGIFSIFSNSKCTKVSIFSGFLHSLRWSGPRKLPRYFQA